MAIEGGALLNVYSMPMGCGEGIEWSKWFNLISLSLRFSPARFYLDSGMVPCRVPKISPDPEISQIKLEF